MVTKTKYLLRLFLLLMFSVVNCNSNSEEMLDKLDEMLLEMKSQRYSRGIADKSKIWQEYEFGSGVGNRDELIVTNVSIEEDEILPKDATNWQFLANSDMGFLASSSDSNLFLYRIGDDEGSHVTLKVTGKILTFKLINLPNSDTTNDSLVVILCVESDYEINLQWYEFSVDKFVWFWTWPVHKRVNKLEFFRQNGQNKLLLLIEASNHMGKKYSSIVVYGFNHTSNFPDFWLCQRLWIPKTENIQICPIYENTVLMLQSENSVLLYEYRDSVTKEGLFKLSQNITSNSLRNSICFESGHMEYLATSGPEPALFQFIENEFVFDVGSEKLFNELGEITWIQNVPVVSYRDESLLLIQLKNSTVIALTWRGHDFVMISLPKINIDIFDLSKITPVGNIGFVFRNKWVKIETKIRELPRPLYDEIEKMLQLKNILEELFQKQEFLLDETETLIDQSFYKNPKITGVWDLANVQSENVTISTSVLYESVTIGSKNLTKEDLETDSNFLDKKIDHVNNQINEIDSILKNAVPIDSPEVRLNYDTEIFGNLDVRQTLKVGDLILEFLNGISVGDFTDDFVNKDKNIVITGHKTFSSIEAETLKFSKINGVPLENIIFDTEKNNYNHMDFSKLNHLVVNGSLSFSTINGIVWNEVAKNVVLKSHKAIIGGNTMVKGEIVSDIVKVDNLNRLRYPNDYISQNITMASKVTGNKSFGKLKVANFLGVENINGIPFEDFVTLNTDQSMKNEIAFENLIIEEQLQIDGEIRGVNKDQIKHGLTLKDSNVITSDTIFENLYVAGNLIVEDSINGKKWSTFDDILSNDEDKAEIFGKKTFLGDVKIDDRFVIMSGKINGHLIQEFVTFDTDQEFPNLKQISTAVVINRLKDKDLKNLEELFQENVDKDGIPGCLQKKIIVNDSLILDRIYFNVLNSDISGDDFLKMLSRVSKELNFENLEVNKLLAVEIDPNRINGHNVTDFKNRRLSLSSLQTLTGNFSIENLKADVLITKYINGMPLKEFENLKLEFEALFEKILSGNMRIDSLTVSGIVKPTKINELIFEEIYSKDRIRNVVFKNDAYVGNLKVHGFVNGLNLTEYVADSVLKTEKHISLSGMKTFDRIFCQILDVPILNSNPVDAILDPEKHQILTGPITINGCLKIVETLASDGKINDVSFDDLINRLKYLGNNTFELRGNFRFANEATVKNLNVNGPIHGMSFASFLDTIIMKGDDVVVSGSKIFQKPLTFKSDLIITEKFNGVDLKEFYDKAVFLDNDIEIKSEMIFEDEVFLREDLLVRERLEAKSVKNVDVNEMKENAIFLNRSAYVAGSLTFSNAVFESELILDYLNNVDVNTLIPLHKEQMLMLPISAANLYVEKLDVGGGFNGFNLNDIIADTFMLFGDQNITGNIVFYGDVQTRQDFNASFINGFDVSRIVSLVGNDTMIGNFIFEKPLILMNNLRILGPLNNNIDPLAWEATAIYQAFPTKQIVSGNWIVQGDAFFERDVLGNDLMNGFDVRELAKDLKIRNSEIEMFLDNAKMDIESVCQDLASLQKFAKDQIYKFKFFEYFQILDFEKNIISAHHFHLDESEYLLINFDNCNLDVFVFNGSLFAIAFSIPDFGLIENWTTLTHQNDLYFLTVGRIGCGRNAGNIWKFNEGNFIHISNLGDVRAAINANDNVILAISEKGLEKWSLNGMNNGSFENRNFDFPGNERTRFISKNDKTLIVDENFIHEFDSEYMNLTSLHNYFGTGEIVSFRAGIFQSEMFLHYDKKFSENNIFIHSGDLSTKRILQTIETRKPKSFLIFNFPGLTETLLTFVENDKYLKVYEYKGVEGFVHRESLKIQAEKTFGFKLRKNSKLSKINCIGAINKNQLIILEARMYGEKLDMEKLICAN